MRDPLNRRDRHRSERDLSERSERSTRISSSSSKSNRNRLSISSVKERDRYHRDRSSRKNDLDLDAIVANSDRVSCFNFYLLNNYR